MKPKELAKDIDIGWKLKKTLWSLGKICKRSVSVYVCYVAVRTIVLSRRGCCGFSVISPYGNCTYAIEVLFPPTVVQSDEPSDLRGSLSPTTRHVLVYTAPGTGSPRRSPIQLWTELGVA